MFKTIIYQFKNLNNITYTIMKNGFKFCFLLSIISSLILIKYQYITYSPITYHIGLSLFKLCLYLAIEFIICGLVVDNISKRLI